MSVEIGASLFISTFVNWTAVKIFVIYRPTWRYFYRAGKLFWNKEYLSFGKNKKEYRWDRMTYKPIMDIEEACWILDLPLVLFKLS